MKHSNAYKAGFNDAASGFEYGCPYPYGTDKHEDYQRGWEAGLKWLEEIGDSLPPNDSDIPF